jgi:hypothetical protein
MSLRKQLHGSELWEDTINELLQELPADSVKTEYGEYAVLDAIYSHLGKYVPYPDTRKETYAPRQTQEGRESSSATFAFWPKNVEVKSEWFCNVNTLEVLFGYEWSQKYDDASDQETLTDREKRFGSESHETPKYIIGGTLVKPFVTANPKTAAEYIADELVNLSQRMAFLMDLEQITADLKSSADNPKTLKSPVNVFGVGEKTTENMANEFAVPSNFIPYGKSAAEAHTSTSWGNEPKTDKLMKQVRTVTETYYKRHRNNETRTELLPEDLFKYPKRQPGSVIETGLPHYTKRIHGRI